MTNNILLNSTKAVFEPHLFTQNDLPFIYHTYTISSCDFANMHENLELLYFKSGNGYVIYDSEKYPVQAGDLIVVNSYVTHQIFTDQYVDRLCLIIDNNFCRFHHFDVCDYLFTPFIHDKQVSVYFDTIIQEHASQQNFSCMGIQTAVLSLLLYLCRHYSTIRKEPVHRPASLQYICPAIEYIKANLHQKLTADSVAASAGLSKYYFLREFKKITGYTLTHYINLLRCEYAKDLLINGRYSVKETALLCGFENFTHFTNVFRTHTGLTPSAFLKMHG